MPKFNLAKYDPKADSSKNTDKFRALSKTERGVILVVTEGKCQDGCGADTAKGKKFVQGHDAKMKGILIRAHLASLPVTLTDGKTPDQIKTRTAKAIATEMSSDKYDWAAALDRAKASHDQPRPERPRKAPAKKATKPATKKGPAKKQTAKKAAPRKAPKAVADLVP